MESAYADFYEAPPEAKEPDEPPAPEPAPTEEIEYSEYYEDEYLDEDEYSEYYEDEYYDEEYGEYYEDYEEEPPTSNE